MSYVLRGLQRLPGSIKSVVFSVCLLAAAQNLLLLSLPLYTIQLFDRVLSTGSVETLIALTALAAIALAAMSLIDGLATLALRRTGSNLIAETQLGKSKFERTAEEESASVVYSMLSSQAFRAYLDLPWVSVFLIVLLALDATLVVVCICGMVALLAAAHLSPVHSPQEVAPPKLSEHQRIYAAACGMSERVQSVLRGSTLTSTRAHDTDARYEARATSLMRYVRMLVQVVLLGTGCYLVLLGELTPGGIIAASILGARALSPFEHARAIGRSGKPFWESAVKLATSSPDQLRSGAVAVENVVEINAAYAADTSVHTGITGPISLQIRRGETLGIVQGYGAGAETVARLAACLETPVRGHVRSAQHDRDEQPVVAALSNSPLYEGTVVENICCFATPDQRRLNEALTAAGISSAVQGLDNGLETVLRGDGYDLDGPMRQALILARVFYLKSALKIFVDSPPNALDAWLSTGHPECGALIVTNDRSVLRKCDRILMMAGGRMKATSKPGEVADLFGGAGARKQDMEDVA